MIAFSDEALSAFLDGEAEPAVAERILGALETDPLLAERLDALRRADTALHAAMDGLLEGPPPLALLAALERAPSAEILPFRRKAVSALTGWAPAAAAAALVLGVALGLAAPRRDAALVAVGDGGPVAGKQLAAALSSARGGTAVDLMGARMIVALSFRAGDGRLCRQFQLAANGGGSAAVACRDPGDWRLEGWTRTMAQPEGGYRTAGGPDDAVLAAVVGRLGLIDTLDARAESTAIGSHWARSAPAPHP